MAPFQVPGLPQSLLRQYPLLSSDLAPSFFHHSTYLSYNLLFLFCFLLEDSEGQDLVLPATVLQHTDEFSKYSVSERENKVEEHRSGGVFDWG